MREHMKTITLLVVLAAAGWFASCNSTIDNEPNVVMEVENLTISPVSSSLNSATDPPVCTYTVTAANATFKNKPKNQFASTSPFNDIILQSVNITYQWDDGYLQGATTAGLGGSVPANGSTSALFSVISNARLEEPVPPALPSGRAGHTASLGLTFNGITVSGDTVSVSTGATLQVNSCTTTVGACCGPADLTLCQSNICCDAVTSAACSAASGQFAGTGSVCTTVNVCP